jgi:hypothetical protein
MTAEWIISRLPEDVRSAWPKYDFELRELTRLPNGQRPESKLRSLYDIVQSTADDSRPRQFLVNGADARDDLWNRLKSGELVATGIPDGSENRRTILAMEWLDLDSFDPDLGWPTDAVGRGFKSLLRFRSVVVPSQDVLRIWPGCEPNRRGEQSVLAQKKADALQDVSSNFGGRPEEYEWDQIKAFATKLIRDNGAPSKNNKKLPTKQALIDAICREWDKRDIQLAHSTLRRHLSKWLDEMGRA